MSPRTDVSAAVVDDAVRAWVQQSSITDPGRHQALFDALPAAVDPLCDDVAGLVSHYVASGIPFSRERLAEVDSRWVEDILTAIVDRDPAPLTEAREPAERFATTTTRSSTGWPRRSSTATSPWTR